MLTVRNFFKEEYQQTAYTINAYIAPGPMAARLNSLNRQAVADGHANVKLEFDFVKKSKTRTNKRKPSENEGTSKKTAKKRRVEEASIIEVDDMYESDAGFRPVEVVDDEDSTEGECFDWSFSMRDELVPRPTVRKCDEVIVLSDND